MSQTRRTLSPAVYRRRRIATALVLAVIVGLIWAGVNAVGSWLGASSTPEPTPLPEGLNESSVVVEAGEPCPPGTVSLMAQVGDSQGALMNKFSADQTPHIWFTLTNTQTRWTANSTLVPKFNTSPSNPVTNKSGPQDSVIAKD